MTRGWKIAASLAAAVVAFNLLLAALRDTTGGTPGGPESSSYATAPAGDAAYASLLAWAGHTVTRSRREPSGDRRDPSDTVVLLDPPFVLGADAGALRTFVERGGRLVTAPRDGRWIRTITPDAPEWSSRGSRIAHPVAKAPEVAGVRRIETAGTGSWRGAKGILAGRNAVAAVAGVGAGRVVLLADASPLQNRYLGRADDAAFALRIAGAPSRRVVFLESYHGYGRSTGLRAIPARWRVALLLAALAVLVFMFSRARRFGPPEAESRDLPPPRIEYVDALAATLARTRDPDALAPLRLYVRRRVTSRGGLAPDAPDDAVAAAAARLGFAPDEVAAVAGTNGADEVVLGRAFARVGRWRGGE